MSTQPLLGPAVYFDGINHSPFLCPSSLPTVFLPEYVGLKIKLSSQTFVCGKDSKWSYTLSPF